MKKLKKVFNFLGIMFTFFPVMAGVITKTITKRKSRIHLSLRVWENKKEWLFSAFIPSLMIALGSILYFIVFNENYSGVFELGNVIKGSEVIINVRNPIFFALICVVISAIMIPIQLLELGEEIGWRGYLLGFQKKKYGVNIIGGLHLKMPDCIGDVKALKKSLEENKEIVKRADIKIKGTVDNIKNGQYSRDGLTFVSHLAGLFGQRLYFYKKTYRLKDKLKINYEKCISCGKCSSLCPMNNIKMSDNKPITQNKCTSCYRCISNCPKQAITLIGNEVLEQCTIEKYIDNTL